jgi:hypothetical protein
MAHKRIGFVVLVFVLLSFLFMTNAFSDEPSVETATAQASQDTEKVTQERGEVSKYTAKIEFLTGYGLAKLREKGSYRLMPIFVDFNFDLKPIIPQKIANCLGLLQVGLEPFVVPVFDPNGNVELGNNFTIKIGLLPETERFQPYVRCGIGFIYLTQHTREQGTQFNFNEFGGAGVHYFLKKNLALTLEYRYRHTSNAGMRDPNSGINTNFALCGIATTF